MPGADFQLNHSRFKYTHLNVQSNGSVHKL